jgi:plastocyanin
MAGPPNVVETAPGMGLWLAAFGAGVTAALLVAGLPASAADTTVNAVTTSRWDPDPVAIQIGDTVTWMNSTGAEHNVCVASAGAAAGANCDEFLSGTPSATWPSGGYSHVFNAAGTYQYECTKHTNMTGTITVGGGATTTTTSTTATETTPTQTQTQTTPMQTETAPTQAAPTATPDTTPPAYTGALRRRATRRALVLDLGSSEDATLRATVFRRRPDRRSFALVGRATLAVHAGRNVVTLPRRATGRLRSGAYRVRLVLADATGNRSAARTLRFKIA